MDNFIDNPRIDNPPPMLYCRDTFNRGKNHNIQSKRNVYIRIVRGENHIYNSIEDEVIISRC